MTTRRSMTRWRLEWLRLTRSARGWSVVGVYAFFGLTGPLMAKYLPDLMKQAAGSGMTITVPAPQPADGIAQFAHQAGQIGLVTVMIVAASVLAFDAQRGLALFYRTRTRGAFALIWPRVVMTWAAAATGYLLGTAAAWYGTWAILGGLPAGRVLPGALCYAVFLLFVVAVVAASAMVGRGTLASVGIAAVVLLVVLPVAGTVEVLAPWTPTSLLSAPGTLAAGAGLGDALRSVAVCLVAVPVLLTFAGYRSNHRET